MTTLALLHEGAHAALHGHGHFSWTHFHVHASVFIGCALLLGGYMFAVGPFRDLLDTRDEGISRWRIASFVAGILVLFLALNGPIHDLSDYYLFSAHMVQHMLLMMIMPPLLLLGTPAWLIRPLLRNQRVFRVARSLTHPAVAFVVYNVVFIGWHLPQLYNLALENHNLHIFQHLMFMAAAVIMWWPIVNPVPELKRIGRPLQVVYLFAYGIPMTVVSAMISLSGSVLYPFYADAPRIFELSTLADQTLGGLIMWVPGMLIYWTAVTIVFLKWAKSADREEARLRRERELARAG